MPTNPDPHREAPQWYWLSSERMTICVDVDSGNVIRRCSPIVRVFIGQPLANLRRWMMNQGGFRCEGMYD